MKSDQDSKLSKAGWSVPEWCESATISRATFYLLSTKPQLVKIGRRTIVIESPESYLRRIAESRDSQLKVA